MADKRIQWGRPVKSLEKAQRKLKQDLKFYGAGGKGDCAYLEKRNPEIVPHRHKDGSIWYHTEVDDVVLPLELV